MNKKDKIRALKTIEPTVLNVTLSEMEYEFEAATPEGFIYSTPGMLLNSHQGQLPPEFTDEDQSNESIKALLLQDEWDVVDWDDVDSIIIDDVYKLIFDFTKMPLYEKVNQALSQEQINGLTKVQLTVIRNGIALRMEEIGEKNITPDEIQSIYELVTQHLLPSQCRK